MFNVGDKIKLNSDLCPLDKQAQKDFQFGKLGYFAVMLDWEIEITKVFEHSYNGTMVTGTPVNVEGVTCDITFRAEDVVSIGTSKFNIEYEVVGQVKKNQPEIDRLLALETKLQNFRDLEKLSGKKISDLKSNYTALCKVRKELKEEFEKPETIAQVKTKHGVFAVDCDLNDANKVIASLRRQIKVARKQRQELSRSTKVIAGNLSYEKVAGVLAKPGTFLALNEKFAINVIKEHKKPVSSENYVGIEIEMLSSKTIEEMNKEFIKARLHRMVNIGTDGSIRTDLDSVRTMELRILLPESQLESGLKQICEVLRRNDCYANRSCGMHVHLDMRNRDAELAYTNLFKLQDLMLATQPLTRRSNTYCKPNTKDGLKLKDFPTSDRYKVINTDSYAKHSTIEIRLHDGATKFRDVYNWAKFLVDTVNQKSKFKSSVSSISDLEKLGYLDSKVIAHLDERIQEYAV